MQRVALQCARQEHLERAVREAPGCVTLQRERPGRVRQQISAGEPASAVRPLNIPKIGKIRGYLG
jgi:hypothetical protein